jgi:hypothetical protein
MADLIEGLRANTPVQANSLVVKTGKGYLAQVFGYNTLAGTQFLQVFDSATLPIDTTVPLLVIALAASAPFQLQFNFTVMEMQNGIVICNSTTGPTKTIGAANCLITAIYF